VLVAADQGSGGSNFLSYLPIILIFVAVYFLLIRPQSKRRRESQQMQSQLGPGDEVQTVGGLFGTVISIDDDAVTIEAAPGVNMRYARGAIARVVKRNSDTDTDTDTDSDDVANSDAKKTIEQG
jgi:preprotein translocase subunit YajC